MPRLAALLALALPLTACTPHPPAAPAPTPAEEIAAPANRTWDAVIETFAERNIPIRNMERASGFISTDALGIDLRASTTWADCGRVMGMAVGATRATYNVLVRGDSAHSTAKVTARWTTGGTGSGLSEVPLTECSTKGTWEKGLQAAIKARAEQSTASK